MKCISESQPRSKKAKRLGPMHVIPPDQYEAFDVDTTVEGLRALIPLGLMQVHTLLEAEVCTLASTRYARKSPQVPLRIPRVRHVFGASALVQRWQWYKRENVVRHLPKGEQATWRTRLQRAYQRPTYVEAQTALHRLQRELEVRNQSAAALVGHGLARDRTAAPHGQGRSARAPPARGPATSIRYQNVTRDESRII